MLSNKLNLSRTLAVGMLLSSMISTHLSATVIPTTTNTQDYLIIATGSGEAFNSNGGEFGADQEVVSSGKVAIDAINDSYKKNGSSGVELTGIFIDKEDHDWVVKDKTQSTDGGEGGTVGISDYLEGANLLQEAPDYSGNVAITNSGGTVATENSDYFADLGIQCNSAASTCITGLDGNDSWRQSAGSSFENLEASQGVSQFSNNEPTKILQELADWRTFINSLDAEYEITNKDIKWDSNGDKKYVLDIDQIDNNTDGFTDNDVNGGYCNPADNDCSVGNNDGFAIIDINVGGNDFEASNIDWILQTMGSTKAIFRMTNAKSIKFTNASVMMGCPISQQDNKDRCLDDQGELDYVTDLGAMFFTDKATSDAFTLNGVILGGVGLWDLSDGGNGINVSTSFQGCTQLVSNHLVKLSSQSALNRCSLAAAPEPPAEVPEPSTLILFSSMLLILMRLRVKTNS